MHKQHLQRHLQSDTWVKHVSLFSSLFFHALQSHEDEQQSPDSVVGAKPFALCAWASISSHTVFEKSVRWDESAGSDPPQLSTHSSKFFKSVHDSLAASIEEGLTSACECIESKWRLHCLAWTYFKRKGAYFCWALTWWHFFLQESSLSDWESKRFGVPRHPP